MFTLTDFKQQASSLSAEQRASLASFLIHSLPHADYEVSDEEVANRANQLMSGEISLISMAELRDGVFSDRKR